jgi:lipoprotein-anchoring transpeptidase ErfK/SrfK
MEGRPVILANAKRVCDVREIATDRGFEMTRMSGHRSSVAIGTLLRVAVLAGAGTMGMASRANAALYYWPGYESGLYQQYQPMQPPRRHKARKVPAKKDTPAAKESAGSNPQAPLIIAVSVGSQRVKIYDANGVYAEAPVSTGMSGHPTPMGVFSVIQKHKYHHSNIYSGAPMPYMQRITWSGVAMHAGVLPGYPASHGCIRMPMAFAVKMWNWTKMGVRVFVTPGEIPAPASFSHPLLPAFKVAPQSAAAELPLTDSHAEAKADDAPSDAQVDVELRSTVGHSRGSGAPGTATLYDQTRTADAAAAPKGKSAVTMSDAPADRADGKHVAANPEMGKADLVAAGGAPATAGSVQPALDLVAKNQPPRAAKVDGDDARTEPPKAGEAGKVDRPKAEPQPDGKGLEAPKAIEPANSNPAKPAERTDDRTKTGSDTAAQPADSRKDQKRATDRPAAAKPEPPKRTGQIAVFISRKDSKLYVRQNFAPLFEVAVTIAPSERPLGTHVFTAAVDKNDTNILHWSVVSLPTSTRARRGEQHEHVSWRRQKGTPAPPVEAKQMPGPDDPSEALDRITVPQDAMSRIAEALATGGSIIVSDQGINQGETGDGTDFIVSMR